MDLDDYRREIDKIDNSLTELFVKRLEISGKIGLYKAQNGLPVKDEGRENALIEKIKGIAGDDFSVEAEKLYRCIFALSRERQQKKKKFGLVGKKLSHSLSPAIHSHLGAYGYTLTETDDIDGFFSNNGLDGFNVTVPYKKAAYENCNEYSDTALKTKSVNTVLRKRNDGYIGYNTDYFGFLYLLRYYNIEVKDKKAVILGNGGVAQTVKQALADLGASSVNTVSRSGELNYGNISGVYDGQLLINTTPVGMFPENGNAVTDISRFNRLEAFVDLIYNPLKTQMMLKAEERGIKAYNGLIMLAAQAKQSAELFLNEKIGDSIIGKIYKIINMQYKNITLIGMPGVGKTTVAMELGVMLNKPFYDSDSEIEKKYNKKCAEIIKENGEQYFRGLEKEIIAELGKKQGCVISVGGGAVETEDNFFSLKQNGVIAWLTAPLDWLEVKYRPISTALGNDRLFSLRKEKYSRFADFVISREETPENTAAKIAAYLSGAYDG